jgi:hypothetical protein
VSRPALLDASFLIALERATAKGDEGPARRFLPTLRGRPLAVSIVTVEEVRACILLRRGGARSCSVARPAGWAKTTRGWWPRLSPFPPTSSERIEQRSNASALATSAFGEGSLMSASLDRTRQPFVLDHIAQISRVLARQYSDAVGPWRAYLRVISGAQGYYASTTHPGADGRTSSG